MAILLGAMRQAYMEFIIQQEITDMKIIEKAIYDNEVVENLCEMYENETTVAEYEYEKNLNDTIVVDMLNFLFHINDVDMSGVFENVAIIIEEMENE